MGDLPKGDASVASTHRNMLVEVLGRSVIIVIRKKEWVHLKPRTQSLHYYRLYAYSAISKTFEFLESSSSLAKESLLHSYGRSFNGFVARLSDEEVARIAGIMAIDLELT